MFLAIEVICYMEYFIHGIRLLCSTDILHKLEEFHHCSLFSSPPIIECQCCFTQLFIVASFFFKCLEKADECTQLCDHRSVIIVTQRL